METMGAFITGVLATLFIGVIGMLIGALIDNSNTSILKKEAIEKGYAYYSLDNKGNTEWKWKEDKEAT